MCSFSFLLMEGHDPMLIDGHWVHGPLCKAQSLGSPTYALPVAARSFSVNRILDLMRLLRLVCYVHQLVVIVAIGSSICVCA